MIITETERSEEDDDMACAGEANLAELNEDGIVLNFRRLTRKLKSELVEIPTILCPNGGELWL